MLNQRCLRGGLTLRRHQACVPNLRFVAEGDGKCEKMLVFGAKIKLFGSKTENFANFNKTIASMHNTQVSVFSILQFCSFWLENTPF